MLEDADKTTLQAFVADNVAFGATLYIDGASAYNRVGNLFNGIEHESVNHGVGEYVRNMAHTNGLKSFWAMLKHGYQGTYHWISCKHLHRYIAEFPGRQGVRPLDTIDQMAFVAQNMAGKRIMYKNLIA